MHLSKLTLLFCAVLKILYVRSQSVRETINSSVDCNVRTNELHTKLVLLLRVPRRLCFCVCLCCLSAW